MDRSHFCGCKGVRTCFKCEKEYGLESSQDILVKSLKMKTSYVYCNKCNVAHRGWNALKVRHDDSSCDDDFGENYFLGGIHVVPNFLSEDEESNLLAELEKIPWDVSQSGRRKQNFGPKCNFKKRRMIMGHFDGFPEATLFLQKRFETYPFLKDYFTVEQCTIEYEPKHGACIDPHIDDCWIWGERIVTVNLLSDSVLTLTKYQPSEGRYNVHLAPAQFAPTDNSDDVTIRIPLWRRSLLMLEGEARYQWLHCIIREDIKQRRICLQYRELTPPYLPGGEKEHVGLPVLQKAGYLLSE